MTSDNQFLILIFSVFVGFGCFILFLLKYRKLALKKNLSLTSHDIWNSIKDRVSTLGLDRRCLLYGIYQDQNSTEVKTILRNNADEVIGESVKPIGKRKKMMSVGGNRYTLTYLLTWNQEIVLQKENSPEILAKYLQTGWMGKHKIEIPNYGTLISGKVSFDARARYTYGLNGKIIGMVEMTIDGRPKGRVAVLPDSIPLEVRLFILAH